MRVLEQVDPRVVVRAGMHQALDHLEQRPLPSLRIDARSRAVWVGHREEVEKQRQPLGEGRVEQEHSPGHLLARLLVAVGLGDPEVVAHHLQHG